MELNKTNPTIGPTTMARQAVELPLSAGRDINNLVATAPNVSRVTAGHLRPTASARATTTT